MATPDESFPRRISIECRDRHQLSRDLGIELRDAALQAQGDLDFRGTVAGAGDRAEILDWLWLNRGTSLDFVR
ncbi:MAG: hypothetical protein ABI156_12930 [Caldimonas sp.]